MIPWVDFVVGRPLVRHSEGGDGSKNPRPDERVKQDPPVCAPKATSVLGSGRPVLPRVSSDPSRRFVMHCGLLEPCGLTMASAEVRQPSQEPLLEQRRRNHVVERGLDILCNRPAQGFTKTAYSSTHKWGSHVPSHFAARGNSCSPPLTCKRGRGTPRSGATG